MADTLSYEVDISKHMGRPTMLQIFSVKSAGFRSSVFVRFYKPKSIIPSEIEGIVLKLREFIWMISEYDPTDGISILSERFKIYKPFSAPFTLEVTNDQVTTFQLSKYEFLVLKCNLEFFLHKVRRFGNIRMANRCECGLLMQDPQLYFPHWDNAMEWTWI